MASKVVDRGLQMIGDRASGVAGAGNAITVMSVDDSATAFVAGDTQLNNPTNEFDGAFDSTPTRAALVVSHILTLGTADYNTFIVKRVALHNDTAVNVTKTSTTLCAGVDGLSLTKASTFTLKMTFTLTYASS